MFLTGVSTRKVTEVLEPLLGASMSAQTVSRITRSLDAEVRRYQSRPLEDKYLYLLLDGIVLKVKTATGVVRRLVLCAYGITPGGHREMISFRQSNSESEAQWEAFLRDLYDRGLRGGPLALVSTDGCSGLHQALATVYPYVPRQRCWAHKMRNVAARLPRKIQAVCLAEAKTIYQARTRREAITRFRQWAADWRQTAPNAVKCIEDDLEELLPFLDCPQQHWKKVRTTNAIERSFREVRRRTRPMSCFQNSASVDRIVYGVFRPPQQLLEGKAHHPIYTQLLTLPTLQPNSLAPIMVPDPQCARWGCKVGVQDGVQAGAQPARCWSNGWAPARAGPHKADRHALTG